LIYITNTFRQCLALGNHLAQEIQQFFNLWNSQGKFAPIVLTYRDQNLNGCAFFALILTGKIIDTDARWLKYYWVLRRKAQDYLAFR